MTEAESSTTVQLQEDLDSSWEDHHWSNQMALFWLKLQRNSLLRHLNTVLGTSLVPVTPCKNSKANRFSSGTPRKYVKCTYGPKKCSFLLVYIQRSALQVQSFCGLNCFFRIYSGFPLLLLLTKLLDLRNYFKKNKDKKLMQEFKHEYINKTFLKGLMELL